MGAVKFSKDSTEFEMFRDYWNMVQSFWDVEDCDQYWQQITDAVKQFYEKYHSEYAKSLVFALMDELERR